MSRPHTGTPPGPRERTSGDPPREGGGLASAQAEPRAKRKGPSQAREVRGHASGDQAAAAQVACGLSLVILQRNFAQMLHALVRLADMPTRPVHPSPCAWDHAQAQLCVFFFPRSFLCVRLISLSLSLSRAPFPPLSLSLSLSLSLLRSRSLTELTRQIFPSTKNGHAPPIESRKSYQSVNPSYVWTW